MDFDKRRIDYFVDGQYNNTIVMTPDIHTLWAAMTWHQETLRFNCQREKSIMLFHSEQ